MKPDFPKLAFRGAFEEAIKKIVQAPIKNQSVATNESKKVAVDAKSSNSDELYHDQFDVQTARAHIADCVIKGRLNASVLSGLQTSVGFLPIEGSLLDYKRDIPATTYEFGKLVKHICAFHNMYGGYLIYGVDEVVSDKVLVPVYEKLPAELDSKKVRDLCREFTGLAIEVQTASVEIAYGGGIWTVQLLYIPQRTGSMPVAFKKKGPSNEKGVAIFDRDDVVLRYGDNSITAKLTEHWRLLISNRTVPFSNHENSVPVRVTVWNNLPDRHLIFNAFIGRDDYIAKLYEWFADDFSCVRVLAGAGGLGKTSIAYRFASEICVNQGVQFDSVLWVTAKRMQFRPLIDRYEEMAVTHFSTARELFSEVAKNLAAMDAEIDSISDVQFPRFLRDLLQEHRVFVICDDLDSLEIDDQKRVVEVFQQLGGLGSRFLLTTRKNTTASTVTAIELSGLTKEEYPKLIAYWREKLSVPEISAKEMGRLYDASLGSPLYTESIFRLVKSGYTIADSIGQWKNVLGEEVRNAALDREIGQLGNEAKKMLLTVAIFGDCSLAEVKIATGFSEQTLIDATNELQSLFLISKPAIAGEPRFSISSVTRILVNSHGPALVPSFVSYRDTLLSQRFKPKNTTDSSNYVGAAVNQANAMLAAKRPEEALLTVEEVNKQFGGKNPDLVFMAARALTCFRPPRAKEASKRFNTAFNLGQKKLLFFSLWFETEMQIEHFESAVEVAGRAIDASAGEKNMWLKRRADARLQVALLHNRATDSDAALSQLQHAANDLAACPDKKGDVIFRQDWESLLFNTHDALLGIHTRTSIGIPGILSMLDDIVEFPRRGDKRIEVYLKTEQLFSQLKNSFSLSKSGYTTQQFNLIATQARRCKQVFKDAPVYLGNYSSFRLAKERLFSFSED